MMDSKVKRIGVLTSGGPWYGLPWGAAWSVSVSAEAGTG